MLGRIENVAALANIEQEVEGQPFVLERVREADGEIGLPIVTAVNEVPRDGVRTDRKTGRRIDQ